MCHTATWYHALCSHQNAFYNIPILCPRAVRRGYECWKTECIILPMLGACVTCQIQHKRAKRKSSPAAASATYAGSGFRGGYRACGAMSRPHTPGPSSWGMFDDHRALGRKYAIGDDSDISMEDESDDDDVAVDKDDHEAGLALFDRITF